MSNRELPDFIYVGARVRVKSQDRLMAAGVPRGGGVATVNGRGLYCNPLMWAFAGDVITISCINHRCSTDDFEGGVGATSWNWPLEWVEPVVQDIKITNKLFELSDIVKYKETLYVVTSRRGGKLQLIPTSTYDVSSRGTHSGKRGILNRVCCLTSALPEEVIFICSCHQAEHDGVIKTLAEHGGPNG